MYHYLSALAVIYHYLQLSSFLTFGPFDSRQVRDARLLRFLFHHGARTARMEWDMIMMGGFSAFV